MTTTATLTINVIFKGKNKTKTLQYGFPNLESARQRRFEIELALIKAEWSRDYINPYAFAYGFQRVELFTTELVPAEPTEVVMTTITDLIEAERTPT